MRKSVVPSKGKSLSLMKRGASQTKTTLVPLICKGVKLNCDRGMYSERNCMVCCKVQQRDHRNTQIVNLLR